MQHCHTGLDGVRFSRIVEAADQTELICHFFNIITEIRETLYQMNRGNAPLFPKKPGKTRCSSFT